MLTGSVVNGTTTQTGLGNNGTSYQVTARYSGRRKHFAAECFRPPVTGDRYERRASTTTGKRARLRFGAWILQAFTSGQATAKPYFLQSSVSPTVVANNSPTRADWYGKLSWTRF